MHNVIAIGRRKTATARVVLKGGAGNVFVNQKPLEQYFKIEVLRKNILEPFEVTSTAGRYDVRARVSGGGPTGQADAIRLGIARALVEVNDDHRKALRTRGLLTRDPRMVERKKYGLRKARKRFQYSKR